MFSKWVCMLFGYVKFEVKGSFCERFINLCRIHNRDIWDINKQNEGIVCYTSAKEYKNLRDEAKKTNSRIRIINKYGFPFFVYKNRHRYGLVVGIILNIFFVILLSGYVWNIDINGNKQLSTEAINNSLSEYGIFVGIKKKEIDPRNITEGIMAKYDDISWMSINPIGTTLKVNISERIKAPEIQNNTEPYNVVAKCDGIIESIKVTEGRALVKAGDAVVKGDLLISGVVEYSNGNISLKKAKGEVVAKTEEIYTATVPLRKENAYKTGRIKERIVIDFFNIKIPLYLGKLNENWVKETVEYPLVIHNIELPFKITKGKFFETEKTEEILSVKQAIEIGKIDIENKLKIHQEAKKIVLLNETVIHSKKEVKFVRKYSITENIGIDEKVLIF